MWPEDKLWEIEDGYEFLLLLPLRGGVYFLLLESILVLETHLTDRKWRK